MPKSAQARALLAGAICLLYTTSSGQSATNSWSSGDKGYKLGCSLAQKPCDNSCAELWTPSIRKDQEKRCTDHRRKIADCNRTAEERHASGAKVCRGTSSNGTEQKKCFLELNERFAGEKTACNG